MQAILHALELCNSCEAEPANPANLGGYCTTCLNEALAQADDQPMTAEDVVRFSEAVRG